MRIHIDTGSRLDQSGDTTFAFSDGVQKAALLRQAVRDHCLGKMKGGRLIKQLRLFAACVFLLIRDEVPQLEHVVIDLEYPGHEGEIKWHLLDFIRKQCDPQFPKERIEIRSIGRRAPAHNVAWRTLRGERRPEIVYTTEELLALVVPK